MPYSYPYPRPAVTVDVVLFTMQADDVAVLLVRRKGKPFQGQWALPGGFVNENEPLEKAAARELEEETGVKGVRLEQLQAFGAPGRDPRGHTISVAYYTFVVATAHPVQAGAVRAGDDAAEVAWVPIRNLPVGPPSTAPGKKHVESLAFDHASIIEVARRRLQARLNDPMGRQTFDVVPPRFTLTELQRVYEAVLGLTLDKRNFRARLTARGLVEPVGSQLRTGQHRPAQLYRWKRRVPKRRT